MSDRSALLQRLSDQLAQETDLLRQLYDALRKEHQCLSEKTLEALNTVVENKQSLLDRFDEAVSARLETLVQLGLDTEADAQKATLSLLQEAGKELPAIASHWSELEALLQQCQEQNTINGAVIEVSSHSLQTAYALLTTRPATEASLYDAKGVSRKHGGSGNSLAKA